MLIRLPWMLSRRRLLFAMLADSAFFFVFYVAAFQQHFGDSPKFSFPLIGLLGFWLICSYVIGRYFDSVEMRSAAAIKQAVRTLICLLLSVGVFLVWLWLTASPSIADTSRGFMLPMLLLFSTCSGLFQQGFNYSLIGSSSSPQLWMVLGSTAFFAKIRKSLTCSRFKVIVQLVDLGETSWWDSLPETASGMVVECFSLLSSEEIEALLSLQSKSFRVLSQVNWSEELLQRFPPTMLPIEDLLQRRFTAPHGSMFKRLKRTGDIFLSVLMLLLAVPWLLLAAFLIYLEDGGPVFYGQLRTGLDQEPFKIWKLRSMMVDSEVNGPQWSARGDPRITRIGRLLRSTRIDELPQLWSVLTGTMSLIGPRPERPEIEVELERQIPHYRIRHLIRPGLSGWAQVNYPYGASIQDSENKLSYDLYYLQNASIWLDLLILVKTLRLVLNAKGSIPQN